MLDQRSPVQNDVAYAEMAHDAAREACMPSFGVALFDNPKEAESGWGCLSDGEPFRFRQPGELANNVLWVCTFDWNEFMMRGKKVHNLRRGDFLKTTLAGIAADHGLRIVGSHAMMACKTLAQVVDRTVRIAISVYNWEDPLNMLKSDVFQEDIRKSLPKPLPVNPAMRTALSSTFQSYSQPSWPSTNSYIEDSITVTLRFNRLDYAKMILDTPIPDVAFAFMPPNAFAGMTQAQRLRQALVAPSLVQATVELSSTDSDTAALISFGSRNGQRGTVRKWMTDVELAWISKRARVHIESMWRSTGYAPMDPAYKLPPKLVSDDLFTMSISAGLAAECHWQALASQSSIRQGKAWVHETPITAAWLRAADRAASFELALKAHKANFAVFGYGNGSVVLRAQRARLPEILDFAIEAGVSHPSFPALFEEYFYGQQQ